MRYLSIKRVMLLGVLLMSPSILLANNSTMEQLLAANKPVAQSYHSLGEVAQAPAPSNPPVQPVNLSATATTVAAADYAPQAASGGLTDTNKQLNALGKAEVMYSQITTQKLDAIQQQNTQLQSTITRLTQALNIMNNQLAAVRMAQATAAVNLKAPDANQVAWINGLTESWHSLLGGVGFKLLSGLFAIFLLALIWRFRPKRSRAKSANTESDQSVADAQSVDADEQNEYDFINSHEAVPAKLDLARAYIAMGDYVLAEKTLQDVLTKGDEAQRQAAQKMLDDMSISASGN